jgi:purine-binding chemotaxis protein CheW
VGAIEELLIQHATSREDTGAREYLACRLADAQYAIDILKVQEIRGYGGVTQLANAPAFIKGVIDLRGVIVPIVDLRLKFGHADVVYDGTTVVVILNIARRVVGIVVDAVSDVVELQTAQIRPAPEFNSLLDAGYITGMATVDDDGTQRLVTLLDIERLMSGADMGLVLAKDAH